VTTSLSGFVQAQWQSRRDQQQMLDASCRHRQSRVDQVAQYSLREESISALCSASVLLYFVIN